MSPGARATDVTFTANFRSSRGGLHTFTLPDGAQLQNVTINGSQQPIRQEGRTVAIPLVPGSQSVELSWRETGGDDDELAHAGLRRGHADGERGPRGAACLRTAGCF